MSFDPINERPTKSWRATHRERTYSRDLGPFGDAVRRAVPDAIERPITRARDAVIATVVDGVRAGWRALFG